MRVSTAQFYFQNTTQITNKYSDVNEQIGHISSGKRILTAKDDAIAYGTLAGYKDELATIDQFKRNISQAQNRSALQENSLANAENVLQQLKQLFIQANNGALNDDDLKALSSQFINGQQELLDIANSKDETGGYIFAGFQIDKKPFLLQPDNSVNYQGDNGVRALQIGKNVAVATNQAGDAVFEKIANPLGDFSANYNSNTSGIAVDRAEIINRGAYNAVANPPDYNFNFTTATDLTVTDGLGAVVFTTAAYTPGQLIAFNGIEVQLSGNPLPGDDFDLTPQAQVSVFDTIKSAIAWVGTGTSPADSVLHGVDYDVILGQLEQALNHVVSRRAEAGTSMRLIESQENKHLDAELYLESGKSNLEDLDFAKAISTYEQSQSALQAAQKTFVDIQGLSLFNYI